MLGTTIRAMVMGLTLSVVTLGTIGAVQAQDPQADLEQGRKLVIMHTNDLHGNIEADSKGRGGITRLATLIRQVRQEKNMPILKATIPATSSIVRIIADQICPHSAKMTQASDQQGSTAPSKKPSPRADRVVDKVRLTLPRAAAGREPLAT